MIESPTTQRRIQRSNGAIRSSSSTTNSPSPESFTYAHEDLLSQTKRLPEDVEHLPPSTSSVLPTIAPIPAPHPPTVLSNGLPNPLIRWRARPNPTLADDWVQYQKLSKFRLTILVTLSAMAGYAMCPLDPGAATVAMDAFAQTLSSLPPGSAIEVPQLSSDIVRDGTPSLGGMLANPALYGLILAPVTVGVVLCSSAAASFNQLIESPYDAQMDRTRNRPLPRRYMTPLNAATFGAITGVTGLATLYAVNPLSAAIGLTTIVLYCPLYTIMKRHTIYNTWLGAVVGGLPPLLGWAAVTDSIDPLTQPGAWAMFALLFFWQFPHFNALSHTVRSSYASSGYRMMSALNPAQNARVALRYSVAMIPLAFTFPVFGMTSAIFPWLALVPNGAMSWAAWRFWRRRSERNAKVLFWASLAHLSIFLALALACKKSFEERWLGLWRWVTGSKESSAPGERQLVAVAK
ncbi:protoheme IX farnesyltransferase [Meredithblackwellia eburnea MCA 4105]